MTPFRAPTSQTNLYCGGSFLNAGSLGTNYFARWRVTPHGSAWEPITGAPGGQVSALVVFDLDGPGGAEPVLIVGGSFASAGGSTVNGVAAWDGVAWSVLGTGFTHSGTPGHIESFLVVEPGQQGLVPPGLYAAGDFEQAGGSAANSIARWNGDQWVAVPGGVVSQGGAGWISAMALYDPDGPGPTGASVYVTGGFETAGAESAKCIAGWDGSAWFSLGTGLGGSDGLGYALIAADLDGQGPEQPSLVVGGSFMSAGPINTRDVARWDGAAWSALGTGLGTEHSQRVHEFFMFDADGDGPEPSQLTAVGSFLQQSQGSPGYAARWNGTAWVPVAAGPPPLIPPAECGGVFDEDGPGPLPPSLYVGAFRGITRYGCRMCAANCDQGAAAPVLNVNDFVCFLNAYAAGNPYANCDGSTTPPVLNVNDFTCFSNRYAAGCH